MWIKYPLLNIVSEVVFTDRSDIYTHLFKSSDCVKRIVVVARLITIEKIVDLVFTEMIRDKMQLLEKEELAKQDQTDGNHRSRFKKCSEVLDRP